MPVTLKLAKDQKQATQARKVRVKEKDPLANQGHASPTGSNSTTIGANRKILVVDDNPVVLKAFDLKLKADGFCVTTLANAAEVASTADQTGTELILLDINFPPGGAMEWTGFTVMQWLQRFPEVANIPIILITGSDKAHYREEALACGAVGFFEKPVDYKILLEVILEVLGPPPPPLHPPPPPSTV